MIRLTLTALWHLVYRKACKPVEMWQPHDEDLPIHYTCWGCGRTSKEYS